MTRASSGVARALWAAILFGLSTPLAKLLVSDIPPQMLAGLCYLGSGLGLGITWLLRGRVPGRLPLTPRDAGWLAAAVLFGGVIAPPLQMLGVQRTPASTASLLLNLEGVLTALLAWIVFREHVSRRTAGGMAAVIAGGAVLSWQGLPEGGSVLGPVAIIGACLGWALDNNLTQKVSGNDSVQMAAIKGLAAGLVNVGLAHAGGATWPEAPQVAAALSVGVACYGVSLVLFVEALARLGTARTGAYFSLAPFVGAAGGILFWREPIGAALATSAALMAAGVWMLLGEHHEHDHEHEAIEHTHEHVHDEHHRHDHEAGAPGEPHVHPHRHDRLVHRHAHYPDLHHRHGHSEPPGTDGGPGTLPAGF